MDKAPIQILCVFSTLDSGGAESMCMNLYRNIDRNIVQFDFVKHTHQRGVFEDEIMAKGGRIYEAPRFKVKNALQYYKWWNKHFEEHPEHRIVHGHFFTISTVYFYIAKKNKRVTVGHIHASAPDNCIRRAFERQSNRWTDYPIACSQQAGQWLYGSRPFTVLNNALDAAAFRYSPTAQQAMREKLRIGDELVLGTVANLSTVKNPMGLIDIFLAVKRKMPDAKLVWVGEGGQRGIIEERIRQENITDDVLLLGQRNDVPDILQAMDVFLLPSFSEGLPVSVIEAQAAGLPCFISDRVTREVDITGLCRFLPIDQSEEWAQAIAEGLLQREDTSEKIKAAGYDIHETAKWLQDFYLSVQSKGCKNRI